MSRRSIAEARQYNAFVTSMGDDYVDGLLRVAQDVSAKIQTMGLPRNKDCIDYIASHCFDLVCIENKELRHDFHARTGLADMRAQYPETNVEDDPLLNLSQLLFEDLHENGSPEERQNLAQAYATHSIEKVQRNAQNLTIQNAQLLDRHILERHMDFITHVCTGAAQQAMMDPHCNEDIPPETTRNLGEHYEILMMEMCAQLGLDVTAEVERIFKRERLQKPDGPAAPGPA